MDEDSSRARGVIACIAVAALALLCCVLIFFPPPAGSKEILFLVVGALIAFCSDVKQFYFGSSAGSKTLAAAQTETVRTLAQAATGGIAGGLADVSPKGTPTDPVSVTETPPKAPEPPPEPPGLRDFITLAKTHGTPLSEAALTDIWAAFQKAKA